MRFAIVSARPTPTNAALAATGGLIRWQQLTPEEALRALHRGDVAVGRLDVRPTLDGVDDGLGALAELAGRGVRVLNPPSSLLAVHDKLLTARVLRRAHLPHPHTRLALAGSRVPDVDGPVVVKPRFGSWGKHVYRCGGAAELASLLAELGSESWFRANGALVQELIPPQGFDVRIVVAGGRVVGAVSRVAAEGEWRTNVALGALRLPINPPGHACAIALDAAVATGSDLVGVDLLPDGAGGWTVIELNGAVEFTREYDLQEDIFESASFALARAALGCPAPATVRIPVANA
jgi:RimK family alpha-L-glutamate ligase